MYCPEGCWEGALELGRHVLACQDSEFRLESMPCLHCQNRQASQHTVPEIVTAGRF